MRTIILTELGISVYNDDAHLFAFAFSDPAKEYVAIKQQVRLPTGLTQRLAQEQVGFLTTDEQLLNLLKKESIDVQMADGDYLQKIQMEKLQILIKSEFATDEKDASEKLRNFAMSLSSSKVTEISSSPDLHVIQSINTLDEVDRVCNALSSRLREWYGLHFPELDNIVDGIAGYSKIVTSGRRDDLNDDVFSDAGFPESKVSMLNVIREKSRGGEISDENLNVVKSLAQRMLDMMDLRKNLEDHLEKQMTLLAPNLVIILGTGVAARLLARAGSLKKLSAMPASTIQVLGAERALFRSLKTGAPPPKHGLLFQHALVHAAPRWQRGKIARAIAAKAVIAARVDVYGSGVNNTLMEKLNMRIKEIEEKFDDAPAPNTVSAKYDGGDFKEKRYNSDKNNAYESKDERRKDNRGAFDKYKKRNNKRNDKFTGGYKKDDQRRNFTRRDDDDRGNFRSRPRNDQRRSFDNDRGNFRSRPRDDQRRSFDNDRGNFRSRPRNDQRRSFDNDRGNFRSRPRDDQRRSFTRHDLDGGDTYRENKNRKTRYDDQYDRPYKKRRDDRNSRDDYNNDDSHSKQGGYSERSGREYGDWHGSGNNRNSSGQGRRGSRPDHDGRKRGAKKPRKRFDRR